MKIRVEQRHIDQAKESRFIDPFDGSVEVQGDRCPITLAAVEQHEWFDVYTDGQTIMTHFGLYRLPYEAMVFVSMFDSGQDVEPIEFEVEPF